MIFFTGSVGLPVVATRVRSQVLPVHNVENLSEDSPEGILNVCRRHSSADVSRKKRFSF